LLIGEVRPHVALVLNVDLGNVERLLGALDEPKSRLGPFGLDFVDRYGGVSEEHDVAFVGRESPASDLTGFWCSTDLG
jgi:hypothetical protein